jgi:hypothetical protein
MLDVAVRKRCAIDVISINRFRNVLIQLWVIVMIFAAGLTPTVGQEPTETPPTHTLKEVSDWLVVKLPELYSFNWRKPSPDGSVSVEVKCNCSGVAFDLSAKTLSFTQRCSVEGFAADGTRLEWDDPKMEEIWANANKTIKMVVKFDALDVENTKVTESQALSIPTWQIHLESSLRKAAVEVNGRNFSTGTLRPFPSEQAAQRIAHALRDAATLSGAKSGGYNP